jgi:Glycoside hydrolase family 44
MALGFATVACRSVASNPSGVERRSIGRTAQPLEIAESVYDAGLQNGWQDWGWSPREVHGGAPAKVRFSDYGGWIVAKPGLSGTYGGLLIRLEEPTGEAAFLEVHLASDAATNLPHVKLQADHRVDAGERWIEIFVSMGELNPDGIAFDRIFMQAFRPFGTDWVRIDKIALTKASLPSTVTADARPAAMRIACTARPIRISPLIYGIAGRSQSVSWRPTANRWGGNPSTTYNWETHVANRSQDWFFENKPSPPYTQFLDENAAIGTLSALTIPMIGWVAKDATSYSFPVSVYGPQQKTDPWLADAGNGMSPSGAKIRPGPATRTCAPAPPEWIKRWIGTIRARDAKSGKRSVYEYILDNEPMLWSTTHRDVRPDPLGYDELLERTIQYGTAIREADPSAIIAGPAEWGWSNYFYSGVDLAASFGKPDRGAHGGTPLIEWYLRRLREYEQKAAVRVLDVLDLHYYPQGDNIYPGGPGSVDRKTALLRLRSTRSLWDPTYIDESWINDSVRLLPRMKEWVDKNYPGLGISVGEWNFGGEQDISGALAVAEALGRFAQYGVSSAFYWTTPPAGSPAAQGFLAYMSYDGKGAHFLDWYVSTTPAAGTSLFASRDREGKHLVAVAINMTPDTPITAKIDLGECGIVGSHQAYVYVRDGSGFAPGERLEGGIGGFEQALPPSSITILDIDLAQPLGGNLEE